MKVDLFSCWSFIIIGIQDKRGNVLSNMIPKMTWKYIIFLSMRDYLLYVQFCDLNYYVPEIRNKFLDY